MSEIPSARLKLELLCQGARIHASCCLEEDTRPIRRTRGGLGSGLDAVLPGTVWVNIPVAEPFAHDSPFLVAKEGGQYHLYQEEDGVQQLIAPLRLPPKPRWYEEVAPSGKRIGDIGAMQGTYFAVYPSQLCAFWQMEPRENCRFCSVGLCLGETESTEKSIQDVLAAVKLARKYEGITFVHFNTGYLPHDKALDVITPYVKAVRRATGLLVGVQCPPAVDLSKYEVLKAAGADHVSFCFELFDPGRFVAVCPGKAGHFREGAEALEDDPLLQEVQAIAAVHLQEERPHPGQLIFYRALAHCCRLWGKGRVSGEIIAGLEPPRRSIQAIEFLAHYGAVATVCIFRPCIGTDLETEPPPQPDALEPVFARMYAVCIEQGIPFGVAPNIKTAMVHLPGEGKGLSGANHGFAGLLHTVKCLVLYTLFRLVFMGRRLLTYTRKGEEAV